LYSQIKSMLVKELDVLLLVFPVSVVVEPTDLAKLPSVTCAEEDGKKILRSALGLSMPQYSSQKASFPFLTIYTNRIIFWYVTWQARVTPLGNCLLVVHIINDYHLPSPIPERLKYTL